MIHMQSKKKKSSRAPGKTKVTYPHFRRLKYKEGPRKKKKRHPKLILSRHGNTYDYMGLTEEAKRGHHKNIPLERNPKPNDPRAAYVRTELLNRPVEDFEEILRDYHLSKNDKKKILEYVSKLKKKK